MKGLVLLAMLLMVPSAAYYQKQTYAGTLQGRLGEEVLRILAEGGVQDPRVRMDWLDARIGGQVATLEQRDLLASRVDDLPGVRLRSRDNGLRARGWIELAREGGTWRAEGLMPDGFQLGMMEAIGQEARWDLGLERSDLVEAPRQVAAWERFLGDYFAEPGNRSVRLRGGTVVLEGEATVGLRSDWRAGASRVVGRERVEDRLTVFPSVLHFAGHVPESSRGAAEVKRLREEFGNLAVPFAGDTGEVDVDERRKVSEAAKLMLQSGKRVRFVVAAIVPDDGDAALELGRQRVEAVVTLLQDYGVPDTQLVKEVFVATATEDGPGRVEFLLK